MRMTERRRIMKQLELSKVKLLGAKKAPIEELQAAAVWCDAHAEQRQLKLHELHPDMVEYGHVYTGEYVLVSSFTIDRIRSHIDRAHRIVSRLVNKKVITPSIRSMIEAWYWLERYWAPGRWVEVQLRCQNLEFNDRRLVSVNFTLDCRHNARVLPLGIRDLSSSRNTVATMMKIPFQTMNGYELELTDQDGWSLGLGIDRVVRYRYHKKD